MMYEKVKSILNRYLIREEANECASKIMDVVTSTIKAKEKFTIDEYNWFVDQLSEVREYLKKEVKPLPEKL